MPTNTEESKAHLGPLRKKKKNTNVNSAHRLLDSETVCTTEIIFYRAEAEEQKNQTKKKNQAKNFI